MEKFLPRKERAPAEVPYGTENRAAIIDYHRRSSDTAVSLLQKSVAKADFDRGSNHASSQEPPFKTYKTSRAAASSFPSDNSRHFGVNSSDSGPTSDFSRSNANATYPVRSSSRSWNHVNRSFPNGREKTLSSRSSSSSSRSNSSSTTPKASQEDIIRHNMTKLIEPKMLSDLDYGLIHYENGLIDEGAEVRMREVWRLEAQKDNQVKQDVDNGGPFSTIFRYLEQRGDSVAYVERQGEATPSYASVITEWRDDRIFALEKDNTVDYEKRLRRGRKEYDEAYERNLHEMEHGVNCSCNRHGFPLDPPQPTWTVDGSVRPKPRKGPADPITNHGRMTWEAAQDLYDRRKI